MKKPLVSVILPTYNGKRARLIEAVNSVLSQTFSDFELIIINDASTNDIEHTILELQSKDQRIVYIKNEKNLKLTKSLNKAIGFAQGRYIARIDDDDVRIDREKLQKQVEFMEENKEYGLCGVDKIDQIDEQGQTLQTVKMRGENIEIKSSLLASNQFTHSSIMMRKSVIDEVGAYDPSFNLAEDYELRCRIGTKYKLANIESRIACRQNTQSVSHKGEMKQKYLAFKVCRKYKCSYVGFWSAFVLRIGSLCLPNRLIGKILTMLKR